MAAPRAREVTLKTGVQVDTTYGGALLADQAQEFIDYLRGTTTIFGYADVQEMTREKQLLERAGFTTRVSHRDVPGVESDLANYAELTRSKQELSAEWFKAITSLDYRTGKINIMGENFGEFIRDDLGKQVTLDQADNVFNGDLTSPDDDLAAFDGLVVQAKANGNVISPGTPVEIDDDVFFTLINALPSGYDAEPEQMVFLMNRKMETGYARYLKANWQSSTGTLIKDTQGLNFRDKFEFLGSPLRVDTKMPDGTIIYTHAKNIAIGFFLTMFLETEHKPNAGVDLFIFRYALDCKFKRQEGVSIYDNITTGIAGTTG